jgi:uncharacterized protein (DUF1330 family)
MNSTYKIAAAVIGSFVLGVGAANILHAQAKPSGFVLAEIDVKDQDGYTKDFLPKAQAGIKEAGGKYLAGGFNKAISLTGSPPPNRVVLLHSLIWMRSRHSTSKSANLRRTSATNTPASAPSESRVSRRSNNWRGGGGRLAPG